MEMGERGLRGTRTERAVSRSNSRADVTVSRAGRVTRQNQSVKATRREMGMTEK